MAFLKILTALIASIGLVSCGAVKNPVANPKLVLTAAANKLLDTQGVSLNLNIETMPPNVDALKSANGIGSAKPEFSGTAQVVAGGTPLAVKVVAIKNKVWINLGGWQQFNPSQFGLPNPASFFSKPGLISAINSLDALSQTDDIRAGDEVFSTFSGELASEKFKTILPMVADGKLTIIASIDTTGRLRQLKITGPIYAEADPVTYLLEFDNYDQATKIRAPK